MGIMRIQPGCTFSPIRTAKNFKPMVVAATVMYRDSLSVKLVDQEHPIQNTMGQPAT